MGRGTSPDHLGHCSFGWARVCASKVRRLNLKPFGESSADVAAVLQVVSLMKRRK